MPTKQASIGQSVRRKEDARFLTGAGQFTDDVVMPRQSLRVFPALAARAREDPQHRHARRRRRRPASSPIFTGADLEGVNGLPCGWLITGTDGKPMNEPPHPVLAQGKVRHVGDPVALVDRGDARIRRRTRPRRSTSTTRCCPRS